jgi:hypothetical protein
MKKILGILAVAAIFAGICFVTMFLWNLEGKWRPVGAVIVLFFSLSGMARRRPD